MKDRYKCLGTKYLYLPGKFRVTPKLVMYLVPQIREEFQA